MVASEDNLKLLELLLPVLFEHALLDLDHVLPVDSKHARINLCLAYLSANLFGRELPILILLWLKQYFLSDSPPNGQLLS